MCSKMLLYTVACVPFGTGTKIFENIIGDTVQKATLGEFQKILKCLCSTRGTCATYIFQYLILRNCWLVTWNALPEVQ